MEKIISQGAEAFIIKSKNSIIKRRVKKSYRFPELDEKIIKSRTKKETKILEKISEIIPSPKILSLSEKINEIKMSFIKGKKLSESLEKLDYSLISKKIGQNIALLHNSGIIHGDLTTSNMIYNNKEKKLYFIDFGLGFHSDKIEDMAVDLHLIKEALEAKHPSISNKSFKKVLEGYKLSRNYHKTLKQLEKVEKRGRYKVKY